MLKRSAFQPLLRRAARPGEELEPSFPSVSENQNRASFSGLRGPRASFSGMRGHGVEKILGRTSFSGLRDPAPPFQACASIFIPPSQDGIPKLLTRGALQRLVVVPCRVRHLRDGPCRDLRVPSSLDVVLAPVRDLSVPGAPLARHEVRARGRACGVCSALRRCERVQRSRRGRIGSRGCAGRR